MKNYYLLFLLIYLSNTAIAQDKHLILFNAKDTSGYSSSEEFLSAKSLERRNRQGIDLTIRDYPVNDEYLDSISATGATVIYPTKWFNGVLVSADAQQVNAIMDYTFVKQSSHISELFGGTQINEVKEVEGVEMLDYGVSETQINMLGADEMHAQGYTGQGMIIAVFDSGFPGVNTASPFDSLNSRNGVLDTYDFVEDEVDVYDDDAHGTRVLSTMAAYKSSQLIGTAFDANYYLYVTEDVTSESPVEEFNWLVAAEHADSAGVDIITSSLGYYDFDKSQYNYTVDDLTGDKSLITQAADFAASTGILVVTSAGNEGNSAWKRITMPADADSALVVGAVNSSGVTASFSSRGPTADGRIKPDIMALGVGTVVSNQHGSIQSSNGTSFSAPLISGFAASVWQQFPNLTNMELIELLRNSSNNTNNPDSDQGYGVPDYTQLTLLAPLPNESIQPSLIQVYPNPTKTGVLSIQFDQYLIGKTCEIQLYTPVGKLIKQDRFKLDSLKHQLTFEADKNSMHLLVIYFGQHKQVFRILSQ